MIGIIRWAQTKMADTVKDIWCIHCGERRTVRRDSVVETPNKNRVSMRLIGTCLTCSGTTSTFVAD
jgi:hypothetical protein